MFFEKKLSDQNFPQMFNEKFIAQIDRRILGTSMTKIRGKLLGNINCISLGPLN